MPQITITLYTFADDDGGIETINSIKTKHSPRGFLTGLYGTRDTLRGLTKIRQDAFNEGKELFRVDGKVEAGDAPVGKMTIDTLSSSSFMSLNRLSVELAEKVLTAGGVNLKGVPEKLFIDKAESAIRDSKKFAKTLFESDVFSHIKCIVWNETGDNGRPYQLITLRDKKVLESTEVRGYPGDDQPVFS